MRVLSRHNLFDLPTLLVIHNWVCQHQADFVYSLQWYALGWNHHYFLALFSLKLSLFEVEAFNDNDDDAEILFGFLKCFWRYNLYLSFSFPCFTTQSPILSLASQILFVSNSRWSFDFCQIVGFDCDVSNYSLINFILSLQLPVGAWH